MLKCVGTVALIVALLGCSHQEFSQPALRKPVEVVGDFLDSGEPYVEPGKSKAQMRMERLAEALAAWQADPARHGVDYLIGPGDVLEVSVFALEAPGETTALKRTVSQDGSISLPWLGSVSAASSAARQLEEAVAAGYAGRYIKDPQVTVTVVEYRSAAVVVTGAVAKPGVYYLTSGSSTVLALLAQAGGLSEDAGDEILVVRAGARHTEVGERGPQAEGSGGASAGAPRSEVVELMPGEPLPQSTDRAGGGPPPAESKVVVIDLRELVDAGNLVVNLAVRSGDIVTVPPRAVAQVYLLGYVQRPGAYELKGRDRVDALRAVALAGGLSPSARAENSFLVRETARGQVIVPVDLTKMARGIRPPLYLEPGDTLVVGSSPIAKMTEFLRPSVGAAAQFPVGQ